MPCKLPSQQKPKKPANNNKKVWPFSSKNRKKAEKQTGEKKVYLINCTAESEEMLRRIKFVEKNKSANLYSSCKLFTNI